MPSLPTALLAVQTAGAVSSIAGGIGGISAANQEAQLQKQQGNIALQESQVNANNEAFNETQAVEKQRLAFLANGVSLEGSPSMVLAQSKAYGQTQVNAILNQGAAQYNLAQQEAAITQNKGRSALIADVAQGLGTEATGVQKFIKAGGWSGPASTGTGETDNGSMN
jgi:hypothetical protein